MKYLSIDYGLKRTGFAINPDNSDVVLPYGIYNMTGRNEEDLQNISEIIRHSKCDKVVVGLPLKPDGSRSSQTGKVERFVKGLKNLVNKEIILWDELGTSRDAESLLLDVPPKVKKKKEHINSVSAQIILQTYINRVIEE